MLHDHLSGLLRILEAAPEHTGGGHFGAEPEAAVKAFAHVYAGCGLSQHFYRERLFETALGAPDLETFLGTDWRTPSPAPGRPTSTPRHVPGRRPTSAPSRPTLAASGRRDRAGGGWRDDHHHLAGAVVAAAQEYQAHMSSAEAQARYLPAMAPEHSATSR